MKWSEGEPYLFVIFAIRAASSLRCALFKLRISLSLSFCPLLKWTLPSVGGFCLRLQRTPPRHIHAERVLVRLFSSFPCVSALLSLSTVFTPVSLRTVCSLKPRGKLLVFHLRRTQIAAGARPTFHSLSSSPLHSFISLKAITCGRKHHPFIHK